MASAAFRFDLRRRIMNLVRIIGGYNRSALTRHHNGHRTADTVTRPCY
jgi:hypothetical protein